MNIEEAFNELLNMDLNNVVSYRDAFKTRTEFLRVAVEYEKLKRDEYY